MALPYTVRKEKTAFGQKSEAIPAGSKINSSKRLPGLVRVPIVIRNYEANNCNK